GLVRLLLAAAAAAAAGWGVARLVPEPLAAAAVCGVIVLVVFAFAAHLLRAPEVPVLFAILKRRLAHAH
ncbi:MAG: virulence factor MviN, partial [Streptomyces sp.]